MALVPRSPRGTWLLAAAAWAAGSVAIWWLLPERPRAVVPKADAGSTLGFTADGRGIVGQAFGSFNPAVEYAKPRSEWAEPDGPFTIWDLQSGRPIASWSVPAGAVVHRTFPDFAAVLFSVGGPGDHPLMLVDLHTGRVVRLPWKAPPNRCYLAADGRFFVYVADEPEPETTCWWDRQSQQVVGTFPGVKPAAVAADGRWATSGPAGGGDAVRILVREPVTGRVCLDVVVPEDCGDMWFSADGGHLSVQGDSGFHVIDVSNGRRCPPQPGMYSFVVIPGTGQVLAHYVRDDQLYLVRRDFDTGAEVGRIRVPPGFQLVNYPYEDGRHLLVVGADPGGPFARIRSWLAKAPLVGRAFAMEPTKHLIYDTTNGQEVARVHPTTSLWAELSPDGTTLVNVSRRGELEFWDVPPRKPLAWFAVAAGILAALAAAWARRRSRRLQRGAA